MKKLSKEPLVHFLLIGLAIFLVFSWVEREESEQNKIIIDESDLTHLISIWELQWDRPPTEEELEGILDKYIEQEIFYQEALKMKLDHNDEIVKRRLAQKMQFLSDDLAALMAPPTDEKLKEFYQQHREKYRTPYRISFKQLTFTPDRHSNPAAVAKATLLKYGSASPDAMKDKGDPLSLSYEYKQLYETEVARHLGGKFALALRDLPVNEWSGPVESGYGVHLVYLTEKEDPSYPAFAEIRDELAGDYAYLVERENQQLIYQSLKANYEIEIRAQLQEYLPAQSEANLSLL